MGACRIAVSVVLVVTLTGCSFAVIRPPSNGYQGTFDAAPECSTAVTPIVVDFAATLVLGVSAGIPLALADGEWHGLIVSGALVVLGAMSLVSAFRGIVVSDRCRVAKERWHRELARRIQMPPPIEDDNRRQADRDRKHEIATGMATKAREAASNDDCATVRTLATRILAVDAEVHAKLIANPLVQRCLAAPDLAPTP